MEGKTILVIAGSYREYLRWCDRNNEHPKQGRARYVSHPKDIIGRQAADCEIVFTGSCVMRPEVHDIIDELRTIGFSQKEIMDKLYGEP